jgi:hypothetical protein
MTRIPLSDESPNPDDDLVDVEDMAEDEGVEYGFDELEELEPSPEDIFPDDYLEENTP